MNFPLPNILTEKSLPVIAKYISIPEYSDPIILKKSPARTPADDFIFPDSNRASRRENRTYTIAGWNSATAGPRSLYGEVIDFIISNENDHSSSVDISFDNATSPNLGNETGVSVSLNGQDLTLNRLLTSLRAMPIHIGMMRLIILEGHLSAAGWSLTSYWKDHNGMEMISVYNFLLGPYQFQENIADLNVHGIRLGAPGQGIRLNIPANTRISLQIFPDGIQNVNPIQNQTFENVDGFSPTDNSGYPDEDLVDNLLGDFIPNSSVLQVLSKERAERREARKEQHRQNRINLRLQRLELKKSTYRNKLSVFIKKAAAEFTEKEIRDIDKLQTENPLKFRFLVENYNFAGFRNNLRDFL